MVHRQQHNSGIRWRKTWQFLVLILLLSPHCLVSEEPSDSLRNRIKIKKKSYLSGLSETESDSYTLEKLEVLAKKRQALIQDIKRFIREAKKDDQKTELYLRLAGLYVEEYYEGLAKAQRIYEREINLNKGKKNKKLAVPKLDNTEALTALNRARSLYKETLAKSPQHPKGDGILYFLAVSSMDMGRTPEGMGHYKQLADNYPRSTYVKDSLVQLGDYHFDKNQFRVASDYYDKIIQTKYRPLYAYAAYKKGWCEYNLHRPKNALELFLWVIKNERASPNERVKVRYEALRDVALPFVDLGITDEAIEFYRKAGDPYDRQGLETMATLYLESGKHDNAIKFYSALLAIDNNHPKNPSYDIGVVTALKLKPDYQRAAETLYNRLPLYLEDSSWFEINSGQPKVISDAKEGFEELARKFALQMHAEGQKTKNEHRYDLARWLYAKYIEHFPRTTASAQMRFFLAEILYKRKKYDESSYHYYETYKDPNAGNLRYDALKYALMTLVAKLNGERKQQGLSEITAKSGQKLKANDDQTKELIPYSNTEQRFFEISSEYLTQYPSVKEAPNVLYEQAYLYYVHHDFQKASKAFWVILEKYPADPSAYSAASLILDLLNRNKDYSGLIAACRRFLETKTLNKREFRVEIATVLRQAELKRIQEIEEKGDYRLAAEGYIEYTKAYGTQDEALFEKALYNASVNYGRAALYLTQLEIQERFLRRFPKSSLKETLLLQVAKSYESMAMFEKAAFYFAEFHKHYPHNAQSKNALRLTGLYYLGSGNYDKAEALMFSFIRLYPKDVHLVERDLIDLYEISGDKSKIVKYLLARRAGRGISPRDYVVLSVQAAEAYRTISGRLPEKLMQEALRATNKHLKEIVATPQGAVAASKVRFWAVSSVERSFYAIRLIGKSAQMTNNLKRKLAYLKELEAHYSQVVRLGSGEWGLASIYKIAHLYRALANEVAQAPVPAELSGAQVEEYRQEIAKQMIKPFREKSLQFAVQCLDKAQEHNVMSAWTARCYSVAAAFEPARYPNIRTVYPPAMLTAVLIPEDKQSKIPVGKIRSYAYPFFSPLAFFSATGRSVATGRSSSSRLQYDASAVEFSDELRAVPMMVSFKPLLDDRKAIIQRNIDSERPHDLRKELASFAFLNVLRIANPDQALPLLQHELTIEPDNHALHNLLGLTYLDLGKNGAAKVVWLSMLVRGIKLPAIYNNLGVLAVISGNETEALEYFNEAVLAGGVKEAYTNLGFTSLKYRNGFEAKKYLEKARELNSDDISIKAGLLVAKLQNRELDDVKGVLVEHAQDNPNDPFGRLSAAFYAMDIDHNYETATKLLGEYIDKQSLGDDPQFRQAYQEAKNGLHSDAAGALPTIGQ